MSKSHTIMRVSSRGRITIPLAIRRTLGLHPGTEVTLSVDRAAVVIRPATVSDRRTGAELIQLLRGKAPSGLSTDEIMELTRGED